VGTIKKKYTHLVCLHTTRIPFELSTTSAPLLFAQHSLLSRLLLK
jgi:hypothetical protein